MGKRNFEEIFYNQLGKLEEEGCAKAEIIDPLLRLKKPVLALAEQLAEKATMAFAPVVPDSLLFLQDLMKMVWFRGRTGKINSIVDVIGYEDVNGIMRSPYYIIGVEFGSGDNISRLLNVAETVSFATHSDTDFFDDRVLVCGGSRSASLRSIKYRNFVPVISFYKNKGIAKPPELFMADMEKASFAPHGKILSLSCRCRLF